MGTSTSWKNDGSLRIFKKEERIWVGSLKRSREVAGAGRSDRGSVGDGVNVVTQKKGRERKEGLNEVQGIEGLITRRRNQRVGFQRGYKAGNFYL